MKRSGIFISFLAFSWLVIGCSAPVQSLKPELEPVLMPVWFWDTPRMGGISFAVGYSPLHQESDHAYQEAFQDAAWRLFCDRQCHIYGEKGIASSPEGTMQMGSTIRIEVDSTGFSAFSGRLVRLDSLATTTMRVILVGTAEVVIDKARISVPDFEITDPEKNLGLGSAPIYYHESSSWIEAEREARIQLALDAHAEFMGSSETADEMILQTAVTKTDVALTGIQTLHRRIERTQGYVMVWAGGRAVASPGN
jgi:hypothetical protein